MELDDFKKVWQAVEAEPKTDEVLIKMLKENSHPVLQSIRKQIVIEVSAWLVFLMVYYTMFEGDSKPLWVNAVLIVALLFPMLHSLYGYFYNKFLADSSNIKTAVERLYKRLKRYALFSLLSRLGLMAGLLVFFTYPISFTTIKYILLVVIIVVFLIQFGLLCSVWHKRLNQIKELLGSFESV